MKILLSLGGKLEMGMAIQLIVIAIAIRMSCNRDPFRYTFESRENQQVMSRLIDETKVQGYQSRIPGTT